jgi:hypothetical protein
MIRKIETLIYACNKWEVKEMQDLLSENRKAWFSGIGCVGYEIDNTIFVRVPTGDILLMVAVIEYLVSQGFYSIGWLEIQEGENHDA